VYLRETFDPERLGRALSFLFVWQYVLWAPLVLASGYIGFSQYAAYLFPALGGDSIRAGMLAAVVGIVTVIALYRPITVAARISLVLGAIAIATVAAVGLAGLFHPVRSLASVLRSAVLPPPGIGALGAALLITLYDYAGYNDACALGDEVRFASRTIPRAIVISVGVVGVLYLALNCGVFAVATPDQTMHSTFIASVIVERTLGRPAAIVITAAILVTAFASTFGLLLASARIPFAAARDGNFIAAFGRLDRRGGFPNVALVAIGGLAIPAAFFSLDAVIAVLSAGIALVQGVAQVAAIATLRARRTIAPFRMTLYPLPALIALGGWLFLFVNAGATAIGLSLASLATGAAVYLVRAALRRDLPFARGVRPTL